MKRAVLILLSAFLFLQCAGCGTGKVPDNRRSEDGITRSGAEDAEGNALSASEAVSIRDLVFTSSSSDAGISGVTLQAVVLPEYASNKNVAWSYAWTNPSSAFASGKAVSDYVSVTPSPSDNTFANVLCLQPFGEQITVTVRSVSNSYVSRDCTVDYKRKVLDLSLALAPFYCFDAYSDWYFYDFSYSVTLDRSRAVVGSDGKIYYGFNPSSPKYGINLSPEIKSCYALYIKSELSPVYTVDIPQDKTLRFLYSPEFLERLSDNFPYPSLGVKFGTLPLWNVSSPLPIYNASPSYTLSEPAHHASFPVAGYLAQSVLFFADTDFYFRDFYNHFYTFFLSNPSAITLGVDADSASRACVYSLFDYAEETGEGSFVLELTAFGETLNFYIRVGYGGLGVGVSELPLLRNEEYL